MYANCALELRVLSPSASFVLHPPPQLARKPSAYLAQTWDRASSSLRLRRSNTGANSGLPRAPSSSPFPGRGSISDIAKCGTSDVDGGGGGGAAAWGSPPPYKYADKDVRVSVGDVSSVLVSVEGKPVSYDKGAPSLCDMSSVRQLRHGAALPHGGGGGGGGGSRSNPTAVTSPFAAAAAVGSAAVDATRHGSGSGTAQRLGRGGAGGAAGTGEGGAACSPGLALHHRLALRFLGRSTQQRSRRDPQGHMSSGEQMVRAGRSVSTSTGSSTAALLRHKAQQQQHQQVQQQPSQGVIVLGQPGWRQQGSLERQLQEQQQQQRQQQGQQEPLVAVAIDASPTPGGNTWAGQQGRTGHRQQREQHTKGPVVQMHKCDSLMSAASSSYGATHNNEAALLTTPSLRATRGSPSEAALCAEAVVQEQREERPQQGERAQQGEQARREAE